MRLVVAVLAALGAVAPWVAAAQSATVPAPAPTPTATPPATTAADALSGLTPAQRAALQEAIIKISQNPVGNIAVVPFQNNFNSGVGPYDRYQYVLNVQPVTPFMLGENWNLIAREIIPLVNQPSPFPPAACATTGCPWTFGLGDVQEQLYFAPRTKPGALIWGAGPIFQVPTATPPALGAGKWAAGPAAVALVMSGPIVTGLLATQVWSFAGPAARAPISAGLFQPFFNYNLKDGWALTTGPNITTDYTLPQTKWAVPLGGGVSKTFKLGGQLMTLSAQYYTYVVRPLATPQTNIKVSWSLLYPIKRGIDIQELIKENQ